jgi:hypothetical protein
MYTKKIHNLIHLLIIAIVVKAATWLTAQALPTRPLWTYTTATLIINRALVEMTIAVQKPISITKELREAIKNKVKSNTSLTSEGQGIFKIMQQEKVKRAETNRLRQERVRKLAYEHYLAEHETLGHKRENMIAMFEGMDRKGQNEMLKVYMEPSKTNKAKKAGSPLSANDSKAQALDETTDTESEGGPIKIRFGQGNDGRMRLLSDVTSLDEEELEKMDARIKYNEEAHKLEFASGQSLDASNKEIDDYIRTGKYNWNNRRRSREKETEFDLDSIG